MPGLAEFEKYAEMARGLGAEHAVVVAVADIALDGRAYLKCRYGCGGWDHNWTCPSAPGALKPWEFEPLLRRYTGGVLIHSNDKKKCHEISFEVERTAYLDGSYFAFSMSDCALCKECTYPDAPCRDVRRARPAMQGMGIDVFATVKKQGLPLAPLADEDAGPPNWYSLVLIA